MLCLFGTVFYIRARKDHTLNSDESSEMVLGKMLADEGKLITENWYYSTELRVLNTNLFYSFFFRLTDSWHRVRMLSYISMYLLLLAVYYCLSRVYRFGKFFFLSAAVLFIPFSADHFNFTLKGAYYLPHITITFLILLLSELCIKTTGKRQVLLAAFSFLLSIGLGMGGARLLLILYIPLLLAAVLAVTDREPMRDAKKWLIFAGTSFAGSLIGFFINAKILVNTYHFDAWEDTAFTGLDFSRIIEILNGFLSAFGYTDEKIFSPALIRNGVCLAWVFLTIIAVCYPLMRKEQVSGEYRRLTLFIASAFAVFILFYTFTDARYRARYALPIIILSIPLAALWAQQGNRKKGAAPALLSALILLTGISGLLYYKESWKNDPKEDMRKIAAFLPGEDYTEGYSYFWYANLLTELSNGRVEVWDITEDNDDPSYRKAFDIDRTSHWLQAVSHDTTHPSGKVFLLFGNSEFEKHIWKDRFSADDIIYQSYEHIIFGYENYEEMIDKLYPGYDLVFGNGEWLENGADVNGRRELYSGGISRGPYQTLWPGTYEIIIQGSGLDHAGISCMKENGSAEIGTAPAGQSDTESRFTFSLTEKAYDTETVIRNLSENPGEPVILDTVSVRRISVPQQ